MNMIICFSLNNVTPCNILANFYCKILFLYPRFKVDLQKLMDAGLDSKTKITYLTNLVHVDLVHVDQGHGEHEDVEKLHRLYHVPHHGRHGVKSHRKLNT